MRKLVVILGVPVDNLNMAETLDRLEALVAAGRETGTGHQVVTVNVDFIVKSLHDPELRYLLQGADLATVDGMPLVWGARLLGTPLQARVAGADLVPALAARAAEKGLSVYLLGAGPGVAVEAAQILQKQHPGLVIAGISSPPNVSVLEMDPAIIAEIKACRPDILLVAFGNPKQEKWIGMHGRELGVPVMMGVGGSLDFIAGTTRRAPAWMQRIGLEWLFRLAQEPRRLWQRYVLDLFVFNLFFLRQWWQMRQGKATTPLLPACELVVVNSVAILNLKGRLTIHSLGMFEELSRQAFGAAPHLLLNLKDLEFVDSAGVGAMVELAKQAQVAGGWLSLAAVPSPILKTLSLLRLDKFFLIYPDTDHALAARQMRPAGVKRLPSLQTLLPGKGETVCAVIDCPRALDAAAAAELGRIGMAALEESPTLILNLFETVHLTSAGLACLSRLNRLAQDRGGELRLANVSNDVLRVIRMAQFDRFLALYPDLVQAAV